MISGINILSIFWIFSSIAIICTHMLLTLKSNLNKFEKTLNKFFLFGKFKNRFLLQENDGIFSQKGLFYGLVSIPKSWFKHFYVSGIIMHSISFIMLALYLLNCSSGQLLKHLQYWIIWLGITSNHDREFEDCALPMVMVFIFEWIQISRRLYECFYVSSFSKSTISFIHYFYGIFLYCSFGFGLVASVPVEKLNFSTPNVLETVRYILAIAIFCWSSHFQHKSMLTFAALRLDQKDKQPSGHFIPHGHLFDIVTSPHFLCEIVIYLTHCLVFRFNNTYLFSVALFVVTNQVVASWNAHKWYKETYPNYPAQRKALIPYVW
ncbi:polyprenol reductase-like [Physella acuta]|uniref:polyprenol reductase-like n=1 Tax=Physella acuta TaxID=109671 RepID=UPI0027DCD79B|nr:polyprenol reductase-like [Physella acuta]